VNMTEYRHRIQELQSRRHALLKEREQRGAAVTTIDMQLNVVRSELQAIYATQRMPEEKRREAEHAGIRQMA
jgi:hypothetical protein